MRRITKPIPLFLLALLLAGCEFLLPDLKDIDAVVEDVTDFVDGDIDISDEDVDAAGDMPEEETPEDVVVEDIIVEDIAVEDIIEDDAAEEPDGPAAAGTVIFFDSGGGKAIGSEYTIYGSLSSRGCKVLTNEAYTLHACDMERVKP